MVGYHVRCPQLSTLGGEGVKIVVHVVVECPISKPYFQGYRNSLHRTSLSSGEVNAVSDFEFPLGDL